MTRMTLGEASGSLEDPVTIALDSSSDDLTSMTCLLDVPLVQ